MEEAKKKQTKTSDRKTKNNKKLTRMALQVIGERGGKGGGVSYGWSCTQSQSQGAVMTLAQPASMDTLPPALTDNYDTTHQLWTLCRHAGLLLAVL